MHLSLCPVWHMTIYLPSSRKKNVSLQLTIALSYLPIVLINTTGYNFIPFNAWWPDWKMLANFVMSYIYGTFPRNRAWAFCDLRVFSILPFNINNSGEWWKKGEHMPGVYNVCPPPPQQRPTCTKEERKENVITTGPPPPPPTFQCKGPETPLEHIIDRQPMVLGVLQHSPAKIRRCAAPPRIFNQHPRFGGERAFFLCTCNAC